MDIVKKRRGRENLLTSRSIKYLCAHFFLQRKLRLTELNKNLKVSGVINGKARDPSLGVSVSKFLVSPRTMLYSHGYVLSSGNARQGGW